MQNELPKSDVGEKRTEHRRARLRNYRVEIKLLAKPIYQFRVMNVTARGAGLFVKDDSAFLSMIEVGQIVEADFISPMGETPSGLFSAEIIHITEPDKQGYGGHKLVGLSILKKLDN